MTSSLLTLPASPGPSVDSGHLEAVVPGARVLPLPLRPRADPVSVCLPVLPAPTERPTVVEVEPAPVHPRGSDGGAGGGGGGGGGHAGHAGGGGDVGAGLPVTVLCPPCHISVSSLSVSCLEATGGCLDWPVWASLDKNTPTGHGVKPLPASPNIQRGWPGLSLCRRHITTRHTSPL